MRRALGVVDLGSNTVRLAVYAVEPGGGYRVVTERRAVLRLGASGSRLGEPARERAAAVLRRFRAVCDAFGTQEVLGVATAAVRQAEDGPEFVAALNAATGVPLRILDGPEEAELGFLGALNTLPVSDGVLADVGGGSAEVTTFRSRAVLRADSVPTGAVNLTAGRSWGDPPTAAQLAALRTEVAERWANCTWLADGTGLPLVGVGGTFRTIGRLARRRLGLGRRDPLHGTEIPVDLPRRLLGELAGLTVAGRAALPGLPAHRADVIVPGLAVVVEILERTAAERIVVSGHGLRDGLFFRWLHGGDAVVPDVLAASVDNCMALFGVERRRAERVSGLAAALFDGLEPIHRLGPAERAALVAAAALRDVGAYVDYYRRAKHTFYLLRRAPIFGLEPRQREMLAAVAAYDDLSGHRQRWTETKGQSAAAAATARLGLLAALADELADVTASAAATVHVSTTPTVASVALPSGADAEGTAAVVAPLVDDFRRLFGRPLSIR